MREEITQDGTRVGSLVLLATHKPLYQNLLIYAVGLILIGVVAHSCQAIHRQSAKKMALTEGQTRADGPL